MADDSKGPKDSIAKLAHDIWVAVKNGSCLSEESLARMLGHDAPSVVAPRVSGEQWLANRGFADSRNYSAAELGPLLDEFAAAPHSSEGLDVLDVIAEEDKFELWFDAGPCGNCDEYIYERMKAAWLARAQAETEGR